MSTIIVRIAVATLESVFLIPHFARIDVNPAKTAEPNAYKIHVVTDLLSMYYLKSKKPRLSIDSPGSALFCFIFSTQTQILCVKNLSYMAFLH